MKYTPSGVPAREGTLAVNQTVLDKESVGYHELLFYGEIAEEGAGKIRIGTPLKVDGSLWVRSFRNRKGAKVTEVKVIVEAVHWL